MNFYTTPEFVENVLLGVLSLIGIFLVLSTPWNPRP